jgi:hypothetical protein
VLVFILAEDLSTPDVQPKGNKLNMAKFGVFGKQGSKLEVVEARRRGESEARGKEGGREREEKAGTITGKRGDMGGGGSITTTSSLSVISPLVVIISLTPSSHFSITPSFYHDDDHHHRCDDYKHQCHHHHQGREGGGVPFAASHHGSA